MPGHGAPHNRARPDAAAVIADTGHYTGRQFMQPRHVIGGEGNPAHPLEVPFHRPQMREQLGDGVFRPAVAERAAVMGNAADSADDQAAGGIEAEGGHGGQRIPGGLALGQDGLAQVLGQRLGGELAEEERIDFLL